MAGSVPLTFDLKQLHGAPRHWLQRPFSDSSVLRCFFFDRGDVEARNGHATAVIEPHHYSTPLRVYRRVFSARHMVPIPAARQNEETFKRPGGQKLANVCDHS
jgi:hypothetical protein